ncbi:MAG: hypothetical protein JJU02_02230 [Cryomorphaceae bacterium]|nr:hypothetical protein [Cryomorphaceae bacterium]
MPSFQNHYANLNVAKSASKYTVYKKFNRLFFSDEAQQESALAAYLVLSGNRRVFLDRLLASEKSGKPLSQKYLKIIEQQERLAKQILEEEASKNQLIKILKTYPIWDSIGDLIGVFFSSASSWLAWSFIFWFFAIVAIAMAISLNSWFYAMALVSFFIGVVCHKRGLANIRMERMEKLFS